MNRIVELFNEIRIYDCPEFEKIRIGRQSDGGYVVLRELCGLSKNIYSYGVGNDVSFELAFLDRWPRVKVELFDPTIDGLPASHKQFTFHKYGAGARYAPPDGIPHNTFMKMDVEWNEWDALLKLSDLSLLRFSQMVIEFHVLNVEPRDGMSPYFNNLYKCVAGDINQHLFDIYSSVMRRLNRFFVCHHIHANNSLQPITLGGLRFPPLLETSWVRKDLVQNTRRFSGTLPVAGLDFPNKTDRPDILGWYPIINGDDDVERAIEANQAGYPCAFQG